MNGPMSWIFAAIALSGALTATLASDFRRVVLALWVAGLSVGAFYLTLGSEFLAIVQWLISTLVAIAFLFFSVLFGEEAPRTSRRELRAYPWFLAIMVGASFLGIFLMGALKLPEHVALAEASNLASLGKMLTEEHLLSIEILALMLLIVLIGGGVVARPQTEREEEEAGGVR